MKIKKELFHSLILSFVFLVLLTNKGLADTSVSTDGHINPFLFSAGKVVNAEKLIRWPDATGQFHEKRNQQVDIVGDGAALHLRDFRPASEINLAAPLSASRLSGRSQAGSTLTATDKFLRTDIAPEGDTPMDVAFTPDGSKIIVAHRDSQNLVVFDADSREVIRTIAVTGSPNSMAVSPEGMYAVTANIFENTVSIVDLIAGFEVAVVPVGRQPGIVRITDDGTTAVVGNTQDSTLSVIDIATATEIRRIPDAPFSLTTTISPETAIVTYTFTSFEIAADSSTLILPDYFGSRIQIFDITAGTVFSLASAASPASIAITPDGARGVVGHESSVRLVSVIDVAGQSISKTIPVGADLCDGTIAVNPSGTKAVVAVQNSARVINLVSGAVSEDLPAGCCLDLCVTADGQYCFAGGLRGSLISFAAGAIVADLNNVLAAGIVAISSGDPRAAAIANRAGEELLVFNTSGDAGYLEQIVPSGPPPEADKARTVAFSPDGSKGVVANILSDNVTILDIPSRQVEEIIPVGDRPAEVKITPDGSKAVVANLDSTFVSVIDMNTREVINIDISRRGSQVEISPDSRYAYIAVTSDGDGVWRIDLDSFTVAGSKILTGNMGGIGLLFSQSSGMTLNHDGSTLVTCNSFDNNISLVDTASWTEVARVPVGAFPVRAAFSSDDSMVYVSNAYAGTVSVVDNSGAVSAVTDTFSVGSNPFELTVAPDGSKLFVGDVSAAGEAQIDIIDLRSPVPIVTNTIPLQDVLMGLHVDPAGRRLYAAAGGWSVTFGSPVTPVTSFGHLYIIDIEAGAIFDQIDTGLPPAMLAFHDDLQLAAIPSPLGDGVTFIECGPVAPPVPCIRANGSDGPVTMAQKEMLKVTVSLYPRQYEGQGADWWLAAVSPLGLYWYTFNSGWVLSDVPRRAYAEPFFSLSPYTVLEMSTLPAGEYIFYFGVDDNRDNILDGTWYDSLSVTIEATP